MCLLSFSCGARRIADYKLSESQLQLLLEHPKLHSFSVLLSLQDGANLPTWEDKDDLNVCNILTLEHGDVLIFRDDLLHALLLGSAWRTNLRLEAAGNLCPPSCSNNGGDGSIVRNDDH